ncbi:hypothetical protein [Anaerorhabdus sp.]|uniref:hypothetical protein n=2 Tax=Anaerorhabdus sp. TaxID=1872524 RepID=UPI002FC5B84D
MQKSSNSYLNTKFVNRLLLLSSVFVVPVLTIVLGSKTNILTSNFTYLANQSETQLLFLVWVSISIITHMLLFFIMYKQFQIPTSSVLFTLIIMFISALIPYEKGVSLTGFFHVAFAYLAFILYNYSLYKIYILAYTHHPKYCQCLLNLYLLMLGICFSITMYYGSINGLVEIIYCVCTPILLYLLKLKVAKATKI